MDVVKNKEEEVIDKNEEKKSNINTGVTESYEDKTNEIEISNIKEVGMQEGLEDSKDTDGKEEQDVFETISGSHNEVTKALTNIEKREIKDLDKATWYEFAVIFTIAISVIVCAIYTGIYVSKEKNSKVVELEPEVIKEEVQLLSRIPVYNDNAKVRLDNIYVPIGDEKVCFLTFDDGPSSNITPQILQILRTLDVKATFFVLGSRVELYPELVKQAYDEGHYIANHGYSHNYQSIYSSPQAVLDEYNKTEGIIRNAIGVSEYSSHLFRFPGGSEGGKYSKLKSEAKVLLEQNYVSHINWNCLSNDAVGKPTHESLIRDFKSTANGKAKIVSLMHDAGTKQMTADTLTEIINFLRDNGYTFKNFYDIMD